MNKISSIRKDILHIWAVFNFATMFELGDVEHFSGKISGWVLLLCCHVSLAYPVSIKVCVSWDEWSMWKLSYMEVVLGEILRMMRFTSFLLYLHSLRSVGALPKERTNLFGFPGRLQLTMLNPLWVGCPMEGWKSFGIVWFGSILFLLRSRSSYGKLPGSVFLREVIFIGFFLISQHVACSVVKRGKSGSYLLQVLYHSLFMASYFQLVEHSLGGTSRPSLFGQIWRGRNNCTVEDHFDNSNLILFRMASLVKDWWFAFSGWVTYLNFFRDNRMGFRNLFM